jgi:hypothetical protein
MEIKSNEFIILRLPSSEENISFIYQTFGITQYVFFDERFKSSQLINEKPEEINVEYYHEFREKCFLIKQEEVTFNINEFIFLAKTVDFVAKCFIGEPHSKLKQVIDSDFKDEQIEFEFIKDWYLKKSSSMFKGFRESCTNEKLLKQLSNELDWKIEI